MRECGQGCTFRLNQPPNATSDAGDPWWYEVSHTTRHSLSHLVHIDTITTHDRTNIATGADDGQCRRDACVE
jgi:hypothetical protein